MVALEQKVSRVILIFLGIVGFISITRTAYLLWNSYLPDFHVFYFSALDLLHHKNPYMDEKLFTGLGYPLSTVIFYIPFLFFSFFTASKIFMVVNTLLVFYSVYISIKIVKKVVPLTYFILFSSLAFLSFPVKFTLGMGQSNVLAYAFLLTSFYLHVKRKDVYGGILLGLAVVVKPLFIFILFYFLLKKSFKTILVAGAITGIFILMSLFFLGLEPYRYYITFLIPHLLQLQGREVYYNQGITGFISRLTDNYSLRRLIPTIISTFLAFFITYLSIHIKKREFLFSLILIMLVLIDTLSWQHHFVFLLFPFTVAAVNIVERTTTIRKLLLLLISYMLVSINIEQPSLFVSANFSFILSHVLYGTLILSGMIIYLARHTTTQKQDMHT